jgi:Pyridoxamine 5'-phosphate oxidase
MNWNDLERVAPEIARSGRERLDEARVAMLSTLRRDGSPRISPVEPYLTQGQLLFGAMSWSLKTRDLLRDPRCVLHSVITGPNNGEGELKLHGRASAADDEIRTACHDGWWQGRPPDTATVFVLTIDEATFIDWDTGHGQMTVRRWSPEQGSTTTRRNYP